MSAIDTLRERFPEPARDVSLNLQSVLAQSSLEPKLKWGVALASALSVGRAELTDAILVDAAAELDDATREDARAAAALMAMNNVYYRFRHMIGKDTYNTRPARLRMNRIAKPAGAKVNFELMCLAVSAINGCEMCVRSHEKVALDGGLTEDMVHDAVRIAAVVNASAVALSI